MSTVSLGILEIFGTITKHAVSPILIFCRRGYSFSKRVKDWDLSQYNCDILPKTWIISSGPGAKGRKLQIGSSSAAAASVCVQTADAAVMTMAAAHGHPGVTLSHVSCNWWHWHQTLLPSAPGIASLQMLTKSMIAIIGVIFKLTGKRWHLFNVKEPFHPKWRSGSWRLDSNTLLSLFPSKKQGEVMFFTLKEQHWDLSLFFASSSDPWTTCCEPITASSHIVIWDMSPPSSPVWVITMRMKC